MSWLARGVYRLTAYTLASLTLAFPAFCERLPIRVYSTADGLAHDRVNRIRRDSQGSIWFCTDGGLSRWNGYEFENYTTSDGLPHAHIDDLLETRRGEYWIATDGGLARYYPDRRSAPFVTYFPGASSLSRAVNVLLEDRDGTVLLGTGDGLYRLEQTSTQVRIRPEDVGFAASERDGALVNTLLLTHDGKLWLGSGSGIYSRGLDGHWRRFSTSNGLPENFINQLREDPDGLIWAGTSGGLVELAREPERARSVVARLFTKAAGLPSDDVRDFLISGNGHIWAGTTGGLAEAWLSGTHTGKPFRTHSILDGLGEQSVYSFSENPVDDLWMGTGQTGAIRLSRKGFHTYTEPDGFLPEENNEIVETRDGDLCIINGDRSKRLVQCFDRDRFVHRILRQRPNLQFGFEWHQFAIEDHFGQGWFGTERGGLSIHDFKRPAMAGHSEFISALPMSRGVWHVFEDSKRVIWLAEEGTDSNAVVTWNPFTRTTKVVWRRFWSPAAKRTAASCFLEDKTGQMWIGLSGEGGLLRWRRDHYDSFGREDGVPSGEITDLYEDRSGHVWVASSEGGIGQLGDIAADHPHIRTYSRTTGLLSDEIWCITEDRAGRIYAGTGRGVDAVDRATSQVVHYTGDDGLISGPVRACFCDRTGELWFVTNRGASRFEAAREVAHALPRTFITEFRIRGTASAVSRLGALQVGPVQLAPSQNQVAIDFLGMDSRLRGDLRYQYRLLGADTSWSKPAQRRSVTFASLAPQHYRFEVRSLDVYGGLSLPAVAEFSISPPVWQRWWFRLLLAMITGGILVWLHRYRTVRLLELERIRTRIATDLHDDIGAGLSQIAVLTEVAGTRVGQGAPDLKGALSKIGSVSRELAESMNDIVWSVNPQRDYLSDLLQRMRRFSSDVLGGGNIDFHFHASTPEEPVSITADVRREVYLIFKEAVNNLIRHSSCTRAEIAISIDYSNLTVQIEDNGKGLCERQNEPGNGLRSMNERAQRIGGRIQFAAREGGGFRVILQVPAAKTLRSTLIR
jgi:ligand-binding sensor domain-containing protein/two-component sensor histidine kinase